MVPRDPNEEHRAASSLELFFDLVFVVAVSFASVELAHLLEEDHIASGVGDYAMVFFAIWWAWMNFTWFASAYDVDDVPYRMTAGSMLLVPAGAEHYIKPLTEPCINLDVFAPPRADYADVARKLTDVLAQ